MIFINNAKKKIGNNGLIINLKANNFYEKQSLRSEDFHKLYDIFTKYESKINLSSPLKQNFFLCVLYYESDSNDNAKKTLNEINIKDYINEYLTKEEKLYILFNMVEIEIKFRKKSEKELNSLYHELRDIECDQNNIEFFLLQKHYFAYLQYLIGDYNFVDKYIEEITNDMENMNLKESNLINYLKIRSKILKVKMLESKDPQKNYKEIISHLDVLFATMKNKKEDFAICIGIKMLLLQEKQIVSFEECIKLIEEMLDVLKRETLFGKTHKHILEQYLYLSGLLGYFNSINDNSEGIIKASKKLDKYLSDVNEIVKEESNEKKLNKDKKDLKKEDTPYKDLYIQYSYLNTMLKSSINFNNESALKESQNSIRKIREKINKSEIDILNICVLERDEIETNSKIKTYEELFLESPNQKLDLNNDNLIMVYFYLYNKISSLTQNLVNQINIEEMKSQKDIEEIRNFVTKIIDSTKKQILTYGNDNIKKLFKLPIFKNLFNRFYYVKMYTYYLEGKYKECLEFYQEYDNKAKIEFELETPKSNEYIKKLVGDCYFKQKNYKEAETIYKEIISTGTNDPLIYFNYGLILYLNNNLSEAIKTLEQSANLYKKDNKIGNVKTVAELIAKIKKEQK